MWIYKSNLTIRNEKFICQVEREYEEYKNIPVNELSFSSFMRFMRDGDRLEYEGQYFLRRRMLRCFALKAWLGDDEAKVRLEEVMWAVCNEFTWVLPAHLGGNVFNKTIDLFSAETAHTLAEILSLLSDRLSKEITVRCSEEIHKRVLEPFINRTKPYNWERMQNNWCAVCGGSVGMTAIYLLEDTDEVKKITDALIPVMESYISSFSDDGACLEGLYYWNYGMMYFTAFLDLYKQRMGNEFPVNTEKVKKMADFPNKCIMGNGYTLSFSDACERDRVYSGLSYKLSEMYGVSVIDEEYFADYITDECGRFCKAVRDIAWVNDKSVSKTENSVLPLAQWAVIGKDNVKISFKGGNNGEPHNHNDIGSFSILKNGEMILCDIGSGEYTKEYFSDKRYDILCNSSFGHSVPIINGQGQNSGSEYCAKDFFADNASVCAEISGAYNTDILKSCKRTIAYENDIVTIRDEFITDGKCKICERFISRHKAVKTNNGVVINDATITTDCDCVVEMSSQIHAEHDGSKTEITIIDFEFEVNGKYDFLVKLS